ncbi:MAG: sulfotransferase [Xenococcaceae cyanobacterium MO_188.B32]|nr:sulfotransferase [Xenococcaceae cyanobacterium MO_188.B32]
MIGTQRSGSNLLRLMLNQVSGIAAPHPPHILQRLMPLIHNYGDWEQTESFQVLVDDVCRLVELNPVPWEGVSLDREEVAHRCRERSLVAVFCAVYDILAETWGAQKWCCKSLANVHYLPEINAYLPDAKYIYLYRDGRDVALSFQKAVVGEKHIFNIAQKWAQAQRLAIQMRDRLSKDRFHSVSYESLTGDPETTLKGLCEFLQVEYTPEMLDFHSSNEASNAASSSALWGNVTKPVIKNNTKKFLKYATDEEITIFELVAGDVLDALGYERVKIAKGKEIEFTHTAIDKFNEINQGLKAEVLQQVDPEDLKRRDIQASLLQEIKNRQLVAV